MGKRYQRGRGRPTCISILRHDGVARLRIFKPRSACSARIYPAKREIPQAFPFRFAHPPLPRRRRRRFAFARRECELLLSSFLPPRVLLLLRHSARPLIYPRHPQLRSPRTDSSSRKRHGSNITRVYGVHTEPSDSSYRMHLSSIFIERISLGLFHFAGGERLYSETLRHQVSDKNYSSEFENRNFS